MKMAVIIGVLHMTKGIIIKGINAVYFKDWTVLFFEVFTGIIILGGLFGWMDVLIFAKWFNEYEAYNFEIPSSYSSNGESYTDSEQATYEY
jgi:V-type H+-transporting ATPase subunit a